MQVARKEKKLHEIESERLMYEAMCDRIGKHLTGKKHLWRISKHTWRNRDSLNGFQIFSGMKILWTSRKWNTLRSWSETWRSPAKK